MPISYAKAAEHVARWERKLSTSRAPYRKFWPKYLFRHETIANAVRVIQSGQLLSREDADGYEDVAAGDVLALSHRAHSFARLYFRPKTPTQFRIEGIRKPTEYWHGAHAPVLVMLVFSAESVLAAHDTHFSNGNMQIADSEFRNDEPFFDTINFDDVYHVGAFSPEFRDRVVRARCAEVLASSPLPLEPHLKAVVCRSPAERGFLLEQLGAAAAARFARLIVSHSEPGIFEHTWAYVESVDASSEGFRLKFHPRFDAATCTMAVRIIQQGRVVWNGAVADADLSRIWTTPFPLVPGVYKCEIDIDGCLAYAAEHLMDELPF